MWLCVCYVAINISIRTRAPHDIHTTTYCTGFYQAKPKLACNSEGTDELPDDSTQLPKTCKSDQVKQ
jgi:hypothetical protein